MKKKWFFLINGLILLVFTGFVQASLTTIGTATYQGSDYKLIYDDDDTGYGGGGLVWLDYTNPSIAWPYADAWVKTLGSHLTVMLNSGVSAAGVDWTSGWRLPDSVGYKIKSDYSWIGDPNSDGVYNYTSGYNLANSEMGHLYYTELENLGAKDTAGNNLDAEVYGMLNTGDFENFNVDSYYWTDNERYYWDNTKVWAFHTGFGVQAVWPWLTTTTSAMAVIEGDISISTVPVPGAVYLLGFGLIWLGGLSRRKQQ